MVSDLEGDWCELGNFSALGFDSIGKSNGHRDRLRYGGEIIGFCKRSINKTSLSARVYETSCSNPIRSRQNFGFDLDERSVFRDGGFRV